MRRMQHPELLPIAEAQQWDADQMKVEPVAGGFMATAKYIVRLEADRSAAPAPGRTNTFFVKTAESDTSDALTLYVEAEHYRTLTEAGLTGAAFPHTFDYVETPERTAIIMEYLEGATWGGPWTPENINEAITVLRAIHSTRLSQAQRNRILLTNRDLMNALKEAEEPGAIDRIRQGELFEKGWNADRSRLQNSRGQQYYPEVPGLYDDISFETTMFDPERPAHLLLGDVNIGNLCFMDKRAIFVDPVYLHLGNPALEEVSLGINILRVLPAEALTERELIKKHLLRDRAALASAIEYHVAATTLPYEHNTAWMDFQQECAVTALDVWVDRPSSRVRHLQVV
jgi:aminoglycoside phosphotransferase (APT) family kinase protein